MPHILSSQNQFNAGEISPKLYSRSDKPLYAHALKTATNCDVLVHGPVRRRSGSRFVAFTKDPTKRARLIEFQYSRTDSYIIEMGDLYLRFFTGGAQVTESALNITAITAASPGVLTSTGHLLSNGDHVYIQSVVGMTEINDNNVPYIVANVTANTLELTDIDGNAIDTSAYTAYVSGGTISKVYEIATPWTEAQIDEVSYSPFGDTIYMAHGSHATRKLVRAVGNTWSIATEQFSPPPTYQAGEAPAQTVTPAATTGNGITLTASSTIFLTSDIGRQVLNESDGETGVAIITALGAASPSATVTCDIVEDFTDTNAIASGDWRMDLSPIADLTPDGTAAGSIVTITADLPSSTTAADTFRTTDVGKYLLLHDGVVQITQRTAAHTVKGEVLKSLSAKDETANWTIEDETWSASRGYPRAVSLHEERLALAGTIAQPQTVWLSEIGIFDGFGIGSNDDDAIAATLSSPQGHEINWMASSRELVIGTAGGETTVGTGGAAGGITGANKVAKLRSTHGSARQRPVTVGNEVLFLHGSGRKVRTFLYDFNADSYDGRDLTELAEHMTESPVTEIAYAQEPDTKIYAITTDGDMLVGSYKRSQEVLGWTRYDTDGYYESVQTIANGAEDQAWVVVKRTINGNTRRYIELFTDQSGTDDSHGFSDSYLTLSENSAITNITLADPAVVTASSHGLSDGDTIVIKDLIDPVASELDPTLTNISALNQCIFKVANSTTHTFELTETDDTDVDTTGYNSYSSGGNTYKHVTLVTGLDHLEGKLVQVKVDGAAHDEKTVSGGAITLDDGAGEIVVGLPYTTTVETLDLEYDLGAGSMQGQNTRHSRVLLRVYRSTKPMLNGKYLPARSAADNMDKKVSLYTGFLEYGPLPYDRTGSLAITQTAPFPLMLSGITGAIDGGTR